MSPAADLVPTLLHNTLTVSGLAPYCSERVPQSVPITELRRLTPRG